MRIFTEAEARLMECPKRPVNCEAPGESPEITQKWIAFSGCSASACMAWQWAYDNDGYQECKIEGKRNNPAGYCSFCVKGV